MLNGINPALMKVLIIGGTGVLSSSVAQAAINRGYTVSIINRGRRKNRLPKDAELIVADKDDHNTIAKQIKGRYYDAIIDYLCFTKQEIDKSFNFYKEYTKQYFFISSAAVYNTSIAGVNNEDSPKVQSLWDYSINKWAGEEHLIDLAKEAKINYTIIRPSITYDNTRIPYGIMPGYGYHWTLIERILHDKPVITWNSGVNRSNMMRVEDFAVGVVGLIGNPHAYNKAFNVCGDESPSYIDVLDCVSGWLDKDIIKIDINSTFYAKEAANYSGELLGGRALDSINSNKLIKEVVPDFKQTILLKEGVAMTLQSYKDNNYQKGISWEFDAQCDRVIKKWCKQIGANEKDYHLGFIDYLGNSSFSDRMTYWLEYNRGNIIVELLIMIKRVLKKARIIK